MAVTKVPYGDTTAMGVFLAEGPAPSGNAVYSLQIKAGEDAVITFPSTVTITSGNQSAQFVVTWAMAGTSVLQAQLTEYDGSPVTGTVYESDIEALAGPTIELIGL